MRAWLWLPRRLTIPQHNFDDFLRGPRGAKDETVLKNGQGFRRTFGPTVCLTQLET